MRKTTSILFLLLTSTPVLAEDTCDFVAYSTAEHPTEAEIRAEPDAEAPVLGLLPEYRLNGGAFNGAEFRVVEVKDGWARITDVRGVDRKRSAGPDGWINADFVEFWLSTEVAFAEPDENSTIVTPVRWPFQFQLQDCDGRWAKISFDHLALPDWRTAEKRSYEGWVRGACGIPELGTCDGVYGDRMPEDPAAADADP